MEKQTPKIFGIGFHKTGTKSLGKALSILGYKVCGPVGTRDSEIASSAISIALQKAELYDAFQDNPWPILYKELDHHFPNSKFILTICPDKEWIERTTRYFGEKSTPMRKWIYGKGSPLGNEALYLDRFRRHNIEVQQYFSKRPDDLLVFPLTQTPGWDILCRFLNKPIPASAPFPHENKGRN